MIYFILTTKILTMKKMILLSLSILGMTNFAGAWDRTIPQSITVGDNGYARVTCYNTQIGLCMSGEGANPQKGQTCVIWGRDFKRLGVGTVIRCEISISGPDIGEITEVEAEFTPE